MSVAHALLAVLRRIEKATQARDYLLVASLRAEAIEMLKGM